MVGEALRGGAAVVGPEDVVLAVNEGRVHALVVEEDFTRTGFRCDNCDALGASVDAGGGLPVLRGRPARGAEPPRGARRAHARGRRAGGGGAAREQAPQLPGGRGVPQADRADGAPGGEPAVADRAGGEPGLTGR